LDQSFNFREFLASIAAAAAETPRRYFEPFMPSYWRSIVAREMIQGVSKVVSWPTAPLLDIMKKNTLAVVELAGSKKRKITKTTHG